MSTTSNISNYRFTTVPPSRAAAISSLPTQTERFLALMGNRRWYTTTTLNSIVGPRYASIMSELRSSGFVFKKVSVARGVFAYRLVSTGN